VVSRVVLENGVLAGLRSLSIEEEEDLSEFAERQESPRRPTRRKSVKKQEPVEQEPVEQEPIEQEPVEQQPVEQEPSEQEPVEQEPLKMSTTEAAYGIVADAVKVPNVIVTAAMGYPLIKTFRGKEGEDVERFLRNVTRYIELKALNGMYKSDVEQNLDHVTLIYSHCAPRVQEYIDTMDGDWEVNPTAVQEGMLCRYRRMGDTGVEDEVNPMDNLRQRPNETFRRYIQRTQRLAGLCKGREDLYESLTLRFCRGIRDGMNRKTLISVPGVREQTGKLRFETCMAYAHGLAGTEEEPQYGRRRSVYFDDDDSDDYSDASEDSDSDSSDDERDRRRRKGKDWKYRKSVRKQKERRSDKASEKLAELQRMKEEARKRDGEAQTQEAEARKKAEEVRKREDEARKKEDEARKKEEEICQKEEAMRKEKEVFLNQQETARKQMEELQHQLDEMKILRIQGPLGYGTTHANLIEAGRPEWTGNPGPEIICYNCEGVGHYESRCWKPRVSPEIRAENVLRINGN